MTYIVGMVSQKGGVGKSTLARMMAREFVAGELRTKIADLDTQQQTCTNWAGRRAENGIAPEIQVQSFASVKSALEEAGRALVCAPVLSTVVSASTLLAAVGDPAADDLLAAIATGDVVVAVAVACDRAGFETASLDVRAEALGLWCQGFVSGLGTGLGGQSGLSPEGEEFLRDLTEISRVGFDADSTDEADETAYAEIVEYVRVGVVLMGEELRPRPVTRAPRIH